MARRRDAERDGYWQGVIRQQQKSGLSISAFCREREVAEGSFFYWRRKLGAGQTRRRTEGQIGELAEKSVTDNAIAKFVPIDVPTAIRKPGGSCELVLPGGCRIIFSDQCDPEWLREIVRVLEDRTC
jgi:hypothetical protein